jgi:hypothetical protein
MRVPVRVRVRVPVPRRVAQQSRLEALAVPRREFVHDAIE